MNNKVGSLWAKIYPQDIRENPLSLNRFNRIFLLGLLVRFAFMPFAAHNDFLSMHVRAYQMLGQLHVPPGFFSLAAHYIEAFFTRIFLPFLPHAAEVFVPTAEGLTTIEIENMMHFVSNPYIFRTAFLLKIPYLLFELAAFFLVIHMIRNRKNIFRVAKFWLFNPAIIYAVYIFGRFETYVFVMVLLSLYFAIYKKNYYLSGALIGLSVVTRAYTMFLVPIFLILLPQKVKTKLIYVLFTAIPIALVFAFNWFSPHIDAAGRVAGEGQFIRFMTEYSLLSLGGFQVQLFFLAYFLLLMVLVYLSHIWKAKGAAVLLQLYMGSSLLKAALFAALFLLLFYLTTPSAAQWFSWVMPFAAIIISRYPKYYGLFFALTGAWFFYWLLASDVGVFTPYLFTPLDGPYFHSLAVNFRLHLQNIQIGDNITLHTFINFFRTVYSAAIIWILFLLGKDMYTEAKEL